MGTRKPSSLVEGEVDNLHLVLGEVSVEAASGQGGLLRAPKVFSGVVALEESLEFLELSVGLALAYFGLESVELRHLL